MTTAAGLNRYPEPQPKALVARLSELYGVPPDMLLVGRGSDEAIDLLSRIYLRAGMDAILQCPPTFGMYRVAAHIQGAGVIDVPLERERGWSLDPDRLLAAWRPSMKIVYLCSPNNPTANAFDRAALEAVCTALDGKAIVAIDEAYIEWSGRPSLAAWLERFSTLAVLRTLSKAHALAGARIGALLAHPELIELARRVIPPYSLAQPTIEAALRALEPEALAAARARIDALLAERDYLRARLERSAAGRQGVAERYELSAGRQRGCRSLPALEHGGRHAGARSARQSGTAERAADLGGHARRERRPARKSGAAGMNAGHASPVRRSRRHAHRGAAG